MYQTKHEIHYHIYTSLSHSRKISLRFYIILDILGNSFFVSIHQVKKYCNNYIMSKQLKQKMLWYIIRNGSHCQV